jgi:hypothetical protein
MFFALYQSLSSHRDNFITRFPRTASRNRRPASLNASMHASGRSTQDLNPSSRDDYADQRPTAPSRPDGVLTEDPKEGNYETDLGARLDVRPGLSMRKSPMEFQRLISRSSAARVSRSKMVGTNLSSIASPTNPRPAPANVGKLASEDLVSDYAAGQPSSAGTPGWIESALRLSHFTAYSLLQAQSALPAAPTLASPKEEDEIIVLTDAVTCELLSSHSQHSHVSNAACRTASLQSHHDIVQTAGLVLQTTTVAPTEASPPPSQQAAMNRLSVTDPQVSSASARPSTEPRPSSLGQESKCSSPMAANSPVPVLDTPEVTAMQGQKRGHRKRGDSVPPPVDSAPVKNSMLAALSEHHERSHSFSRNIRQDDRFRMVHNYRELKREKQQQQRGESTSPTNNAAGPTTSLDSSLTGVQLRNGGLSQMQTQQDQQRDSFATTRLTNSTSLPRSSSLEVTATGDGGRGSHTGNTHTPAHPHSFSLRNAAMQQQQGSYVALIGLNDAIIRAQDVVNPSVVVVTSAYSQGGSPNSRVSVSPRPQQDATTSSPPAPRQFLSAEAAYPTMQSGEREERGALSAIRAEQSTDSDVSRRSHAYDMPAMDGVVRAVKRAVQSPYAELETIVVADEPPHQPGGLLLQNRSRHSITPVEGLAVGLERTAERVDCLLGRPRTATYSIVTQPPQTMSASGPAVTAQEQRQPENQTLSPPSECGSQQSTRSGHRRLSRPEPYGEYMDVGGDGPASRRDSYASVGSTVSDPEVVLLENDLHSVTQSPEREQEDALSARQSIGGSGLLESMTLMSSADMRQSSHDDDEGEGTARQAASLLEWHWSDTLQDWVARHRHSMAWLASTTESIRAGARLRPEVSNDFDEESEIRALALLEADGALSDHGRSTDVGSLAGQASPCPAFLSPPTRQAGSVQIASPIDEYAGQGFALSEHDVSADGGDTRYATLATTVNFAHSPVPSALALDATWGSFAPASHDSTQASTRESTPEISDPASPRFSSPIAGPRASIRSQTLRDLAIAAALLTENEDDGAGGHGGDSLV